MTGTLRPGSTEAARGRALAGALLTATGMLAACAAIPGCRGPGKQLQPTTTAQARKDRIMMTVVYDNNPHRAGLTAAWGFGCVVRGTEKTILFDTGGDGRVLLDNMRALGIDPKTIDVVVLSHAHGDHTGGLGAFLKARGQVTVYTAEGFPDSIGKAARSAGGKAIEAGEPVEVCTGVRTTGTLGRGAIPEHGLCVRTGAGWVLITGCAHPGVAEMAERARQVVGQPPHLVLGGFHMGGHSPAQVRAVIERFDKLGVRRVAPCHCTGDAARKLFKDHFGEACELPGVGSEIVLER